MRAGNAGVPKALAHQGLVRGVDASLVAVAGKAKLAGGVRGVGAKISSGGKHGLEVHALIKALGAFRNLVAVLKVYHRKVVRVQNARGVWIRVNRVAFKP